MKNTLTQILACLTLVIVASTANANPAKKHENTTPINDKAAQGKKDTTAAVKEGDITPEQGADLKQKHQNIENAEQKNADKRHGLVAKGDHAKFNKKAAHVNAERNHTIQKNVEEQKVEEQKKQ